MEDVEIINLLWQREEMGLLELERKYRAAYNFNDSGRFGGMEFHIFIHVSETHSSASSALCRMFIAEVKKREHYVSPSLKRKQKSEAARKNKRKFY